MEEDEDITDDSLEESGARRCSSYVFKFATKPSCMYLGSVFSLKLNLYSQILI